MQLSRVLAGAAVAAVALLSACGTPGTTAAPQAAGTSATSASSAAPTTTTTTVATTVPTTTTTVAPPPPTTAPPTTKKVPPKTTTAKPKPPAAEGTPCNASASACIDLSANKSWLLENGKVIYGPVPITSGRPGYRTPPGTFKVGWKDIDHKSSEFNDAPMPYSVFFNGGIAFHAGSLKVQSHGCIHLSNAAAKTFYNSLQVGETVQVVR